MEIAELATSMGHECFLPQRDALQECNKKVTAEMNVEAIKRADSILTVGRNLGADTAWEVGFAKALGKPILLLHTKQDAVETNLMVMSSINGAIQLSAYSDLKATDLSILRELRVT